MNTETKDAISSPVLAIHPGLASITESKNLERVLSRVRWVGVVVIVLMAFLHDPISPIAMLVLAGVLGLSNIQVIIANSRITRPVSQRNLAIATLAIDAAVVLGVIFLFAREFYTAAYAAFALVSVEGGLRFGLRGGLAMGLFFALGLLAAMFYREAAFDVRFSLSGYAFWTALVLLMGLAVGMVTGQAREHRKRSEELLRERTLMLERQRISHELHDTVLKTFQGLALQARVISETAPESAPEIGDKARFIEEACLSSAEDTRRILLQIREADAAGKGICQRLASEIDSWSKKTGIRTELSVHGTDVVLPSGKAHNLIAVLNEALRNTEKHAHATLVNVAVSVSPGGVDLDIRDNGAGFSTEESAAVSRRSGRLGLVTMKERMESIGGEFTISSSSEGTAIRASVPRPSMEPL